MSLEKDIVRILTEYTNTMFDGNKDRAARSLGVRPPTFWRWLMGKNIPKMESLVEPFNVLNARIVLPGDMNGGCRDVDELNKKNCALEIENAALRQQVANLMRYKIKWEGQLELAKAKTETK